MRTFEIPAAGGFLLHEFSEEVGDFYVEGEEAEFYKTIEECVDKVKYYCAHDDERMKIAAKGYEKVLTAGYTYDKVLKNVIERLRMLD